MYNAEQLECIVLMHLLTCRHRREQSRENVPWPTVIEAAETSCRLFNYQRKEDMPRAVPIEIQPFIEAMEARQLVELYGQGDTKRVDLTEKGVVHAEQAASLSGPLKQWEQFLSEQLATSAQELKEAAGSIARGIDTYIRRSWVVTTIQALLFLATLLAAGAAWYTILRPPNSAELAPRSLAGRPEPVEDREFEVPHGVTALESVAEKPVNSMLRSGTEAEPGHVRGD